MATSSTSYPKKWHSGKTTVMRVPKNLVDQVTKIARKLDKSQSFKIKEGPNSIVLEMVPLKRVSYSVGKPINVSSVPQRSPFRYPGGKTWLIPYIRDWLSSRSSQPARLIEPFAGGAIVSLTAAFEGLAKHVIFSELDPAVSSVWRVVLNGQANWLAKRIQEFDLTEANVRKVLKEAPSELRDQAFQTILRNRVQRGGILAPGAGFIKTGENGRGLNSRWYPETLARRIGEINATKEKLTFVHGDAFELIREHQSDKEAVFYVDPPYTIAARRLYTTWEVNHSNLFTILSKCKGDFIMSYDNTVEIAALVKKFGFESKAIAMKSTHHAKMTELLIGRDLSWLKTV